LQAGKAAECSAAAAELTLLLPAYLERLAGCPHAVEQNLAAEHQAQQQSCQHSGTCGAKQCGVIAHDCTAAGDVPCAKHTPNTVQSHASHMLCIRRWLFETALSASHLQL
jgi:hypothetical protein